MDDVEQRVLQCMSLVFPDVARDGLPALSTEAHAGWDSVAHVTLYAALEESLGVELDFEAFAHATSFDGLVAHVRDQLARR